MPFLNFEGTGKDLYFIQTGEGPDVVLVHGLASNLSFWYAGTILPLRKHYRLTAYDLRGHGKSGMPPTGYTHHHMADDLFQLVKHLGLGPFHLICHSFGGLIAISFAVRYPGHLKSLTLADVPIAGLSSTWSSQWPKLPHKLEQAGIIMPENEPFPELLIMEELARCHLNRQGQGEPFTPDLAPYALFGKADKKTLRRWLQLLNDTTAREDFRHRDVTKEELSKVNVPALVTYGSQSKWKASGQILKTYLPNPDIRYLEAAGHAHPWERPDTFLRLWRSFLASFEYTGTYEGKERRGYVRHEIRTHLEMHLGDGPSCRVETVNVSMAGIMVLCPLSLGIGSKVSLTPPHIGDENRLLTGRIIRQGKTSIEKGHVFGIQIPSEGRNREILAEWIQRINVSPGKDSGILPLKR